MNKVYGFHMALIQLLNAFVVCKLDKKRGCIAVHALFIAPGLPRRALCTWGTGETSSAASGQTAWTPLLFGAFENASVDPHVRIVLGVSLLSEITNTYRQGMNHSWIAKTHAMNLLLTVFRGKLPEHIYVV